MGLLDALFKFLADLKPKVNTLLAINMLLCTFLGAFGGQVTEAWWITTHRPAYSVEEMKRITKVLDNQEDFDRRLKDLEKKRDTSEQLALDMKEVKGQLNLLILLRRQGIR